MITHSAGVDEPKDERRTITLCYRTDVRNIHRFGEMSMLSVSGVLIPPDRTNDADEGDSSTTVSNSNTPTQLGLQRVEVQLVAT